MTRGIPTTTTTTTSTLNYFTAPPARRARFVAWIICAAALVGGTMLWLFLLRGQRILHNDLILIAGWAVLGSVIIAIALLLKTTPPDAIRVSNRTSAWIIVGGSAALQALAFALLVPALSEDLLRYRLDGRMWQTGFSPYGTTPAQYIAAQSAGSFRSADADAIDILVTRRGLHSIYPPTAQLFFAATRAIETITVGDEQWWTSPMPAWRDRAADLPKVRQALVQRIAIGAIAVASVIVLLSTLAALSRSPWYAVVLGWNPLFILETGGMGHVDVVGVLFILLTIRALQSHRPLLAAGMLALAVGVKPPAVLLAPFLLRDAWTGTSLKRFVWLPILFVLFLALVYSPMLIGRGYQGWLNTARTYATSWEANGSIYELIKSTADEADGWSVQRAKYRARLLAGAMVVVTMLLAWQLRADFATAGYWIYLIMLLVSPVVYPWYLLWPLCLVPLLRGGGWRGTTVLVWAATVGVSYLLWRTSDWVLPTRWLLVEYVPVYAALLVELTKLATHKWTIHSTV